MRRLAALRRESWSLLSPLPPVDHGSHRGPKWSPSGAMMARSERRLGPGEEAPLGPVWTAQIERTRVLRA